MFFFKQAKSRDGTGAGLTGITSNYQVYQRWVRTTHERSIHLHAALDMADMSLCNELDHQHRDLRPSEVTKSELLSVVKALAAVDSFINTWKLPIGW